MLRYQNSMLKQWLLCLGGNVGGMINPAEIGCFHRIREGGGTVSYLSFSGRCPSDILMPFQGAELV